MTPTNLANAVIFLDALPLWLFERGLGWMQNRVDEEKKKRGVKVRFRNLVLKECIEELYQQTPPIIHTYPEDCSPNEAKMLLIALEATTIPVQNFANLFSECKRSEWFLNKLYIRIQHTVPDNCFVGVSRHEKDFGFRPK